MLLPANSENKRIFHANTPAFASNYILILAVARQSEQSVAGNFNKGWNVSNNLIIRLIDSLEYIKIPLISPFPSTNYCLHQKR